MRYKQTNTVKRLFILITIIFSTLFAQAQKAKFIGKVTNTKNEALIGVTVSLKGDRAQSTKTDVEGRFTFSIDINKEYTLVASYVGYKENSITVKATTAGEEVSADLLLEENNKNLKDVVVSTNRGTNKGATDNALIAFQKNTNTVASVISAESIKRSPDRNTAEILKRTPGASIQEGKYIIVRGLADRYNLQVQSLTVRHSLLIYFLLKSLIISLLIKHSYLNYQESGQVV